MEIYNHAAFESFVNSERCKTMISLMYLQNSLRALLIQKDVKRSKPSPSCHNRLRALLIQKDVKPSTHTAFVPGV